MRSRHIGPPSRRIRAVFVTAMVAVFAVGAMAWNVPQVALADIAFDQVGDGIVGEAFGDESGTSVAMSADGMRVAVGAPFNSSASNEAGHVRVFEWDGVAWGQLGDDIDGLSSTDESGAAVALSTDGSRVAIVARGDRNGTGDAGYVRILDWNGTAWEQLGDAIDGVLDEGLADSVALSADGSIVAIGARRANIARVFGWDGSAWGQVGRDIASASGRDESVRAVALSADGRRVIVGNPDADENGDNAGSVTVFDWDGSAWVQTGVSITGDSPGDIFGWAVAVSADGSRVAVGALGDNGNLDGDGYVRIVEWDGSSWVELGDDVVGDAPGDFFGRSVAIAAAGNRVVIGAPRPLGGSGYVRLVEWDGASWVPAGVDLARGTAGDLPGWSVASSADGTRVALGVIGAGAGAGLVQLFDTRFVEPATTTTTTTVPPTTVPTPDPPLPGAGELPETGAQPKGLTIAIALLACGLGCVLAARRPVRLDRSEHGAVRGPESAPPAR